ncbi:MAG TPA: hypothetical protein VI584_08905, partial [Nitrospiria bacterium]|nr:hypothetical protein [Nitrospiria bacterium]
MVSILGVHRMYRVTFFLLAIIFIGGCGLLEIVPMEEGVNRRQEEQQSIADKLKDDQKRIEERIATLEKAKEEGELSQKKMENAWGSVKERVDQLTRKIAEINARSDQSDQEVKSLRGDLEVRDRKISAMHQDLDDIDMEINRLHEKSNSSRADTDKK